MDDVIVLRDVGWADYQRLRQIRDDIRPMTRAVTEYRDVLRHNR